MHLTRPTAVLHLNTYCKPAQPSEKPLSKNKLISKSTWRLSTATPNFKWACKFTELPGTCRPLQNKKNIPIQGLDILEYTKQMKNLMYYFAT